MLSRADQMGLTAHRSIRKKVRGIADEALVLEVKHRARTGLRVSRGL